MAILPICRYADIGDCRYADIADIFQIQIHRIRGGFGFNPDLRSLVRITPLLISIFPQVHVHVPDVHSND